MVARRFTDLLGEKNRRLTISRRRGQGQYIRVLFKQVLAGATSWELDYDGRRLNVRGGTTEKGQSIKKG